MNACDDWLAEVQRIGVGCGNDRLPIDGRLKPGTGIRP
jgi:hypothetical protein